MFYKQQVLTANLNDRKSLICNVQSILLKGSSRVKKMHMSASEKKMLSNMINNSLE